MILDLPRFLAAERPYWTELESALDRVEGEPGRRPSLAELKNLHYLYQRASADLARMATFSSEPETRRYLESLVARAFAEIHETRDARRRVNVWRWLARDLPQTFRRHVRAFWLAVAITLAGAAFGVLALRIDPEAKAVIMPFRGLLESPAERVSREEHAKVDRLKGVKTTFAAELMTHNTQVAFSTLALGMTWGVGTVLVLFYNGVTLGAVSADYVQGGQSSFLMGWLMPHGAAEIPAILLAGQAGLIIAGALIGWGTSATRGERLRAISRDVLTLVFGMALLLVWAGIVESFFSQYHEPVVPYALKIAFGAVELAALTVYLSRSGASKP
jgi:uncharacterized membrane protein SpoIIM required for sporulation